jgi:hypothetical protein
MPVEPEVVREPRGDEEARLPHDEAERPDEDHERVARPVEDREETFHEPEILKRKAQKRRKWVPSAVLSQPVNPQRRRTRRESSVRRFM